MEINDLFWDIPEVKESIIRLAKESDDTLNSIIENIFYNYNLEIYDFDS